jgi:hypothetical protein
VTEIVPADATPVDEVFESRGERRPALLPRRLAPRRVG